MKIEDNKGLFLTPTPRRFDLNIDTKRTVESTQRERFDNRMMQETLKTKDKLFSRGQQVSPTAKIPYFNIETQRDLLNRIKHQRGVALRGPELSDLLPRVLSKFAKVGEILFPKEERPPFEHPKIIEARNAALNIGKKKKKQKKNIFKDQFEPIALALPLSGKEKLSKLDSALISHLPSKVISLSCYSRPESFLQKLQDLQPPYPSNDINRKTQAQLNEIAAAKRKQSISLMAQITAEANAKKTKKTKIEKPYVVEMWQKEPTGDELREMKELTEACEDRGLQVNPQAVRRAIVRDNMPKYMTLIERDIKEAQDELNEANYFSI